MRSPGHAAIVSSLGGVSLVSQSTDGRFLRLVCDGTLFESPNCGTVIATGQVHEAMGHLNAGRHVPGRRCKRRELVASLTFQPCKWKQLVPSKRQCTSGSLHDDATFQETVVLKQRVTR